MDAVLIKISFAYIGFNIVLLAIFHVTKSYNFLFFSFVTLMFCFLIVITLLLGGFSKSGFVLIFGIILPLSANFTHSIVAGAVVTVAYIASIIVIAFNTIFNFLPIPNFIPISEVSLQAQITFLTINVSSVVFLIYTATAFMHLNHIFHRERSELLLENVLPKSLVQRMEDAKNIDDELDDTFSDHHDDVVVLFADMSNFTQLSAKMTSTKLIQELNTIFSQFDVIADKYNVEKIKTIGDAYMAMAKPIEHTSHHVRMLEFALEIIEFIKTAPILGFPIKVRIGAHAGEAITGVIGVDKLSYDVWGTTVNIASRIENYAPSNGITISEDIYQKISHIFSCTNNRTEVLKGVGAISLWDVTNKATQ